MISKIALLKKSQDGHFDLQYGIDPTPDGRLFLDFASLNLGVKNKKVIYIEGIKTFREQPSGFKELILLSKEPSNIHYLEEDESIFVIIPDIPYVFTNASVIATRDGQGSILEMHEGNFFAIKGNDNKFFSPYVAVKAINEMFLVQKTR